MELRYADVSEMYRTLERHSVSIEAQELALAHSLAEKWRDLYVFARTKDLRLAKVKEDFRAVTTEQSEAFQEELKALRTLLLDRNELTELPRATGLMAALEILQVGALVVVLSGL